MTIQQFIEKAIEGGWKQKNCILTRYEPHEYKKPMEFSEWFNIADILLDPEVWKAVGKVEGWKLTEGEGAEKTDDWGAAIYLQEYVAKMHGLVEWLCEKKGTIEQYLETL